MKAERESESCFLLFAFYIFGIGGLCSWNAILSSLDFFNSYQEEYSPYYVYPVMNYVLSVIIQLVLIFYGNRIQYRKQLSVSILLSAAILISLPFFVISMKTLSSFVVTCALITIQGLANAVIVNSFYAISSFLPVKYIIALTTGLGIAGVLMNLLRLAIISVFGRKLTKESEMIGAIIFFAASGLVMLVTYVCLTIVYQDPFFRRQLKKSGEFLKIHKRSTEYLYLDPEDNFSLTMNESQIALLTKDAEYLQRDKKPSVIFNKVFVKLLDLGFLLFFTFFTTFLVFPGVAFKCDLFNLRGDLRICMLLLIFNVFDSIGRNFPKLVLLKKGKLTCLVFSRLVFVFSFALIAISNENNIFHMFNCGYLVAINMALFAFSNGYCTTSLFSLAPDQVAEDMKGFAGSTLNYFLVMGILFGCVFAMMIMQKVI